MDKVRVNIFIVDKKAPKPKTAYRGTSAAFDVAASEEVTINPGEYKLVPVGQRFSIDQNDPYYMQVHLRSSFGSNKGLRCHIGIIDAGYTGDFAVSVVNNTSVAVTIRKYEYFAQLLVIRKPLIEFNEITCSKEWGAYADTQLRGSKGFGSSNNEKI